MKNPEEINSKFLDSLTKLNLELPNYISSTEIRKHLSSSSPSSNFYHKDKRVHQTINQYLKLLENWENMSDLLIQLIKLSKDKVLFTLTHAYEDAFMKDMKEYFDSMYFAN